ncbi:AfsA-related hotdog domain-containing protein [Kitasatospora sp. NPDC093806]|uniref:AfsA-related hotdog domain-containing protein n=1 Tax=Kitasatospora sp. NPDC093806 TaxID=3155075 RepID=UPI00341F4DE9
MPLRVDEGDRCFFDHPLDHVPGMLLVAGVLDLVLGQAEARSGAVGGDRLRLSIAFERMCELGRPVLLHCEELPDGGEYGARAAWQVRADQGDDSVCRATVHLGGRDDPAGPVETAVAPVTGVTAADAGLVHRWLPENVLVGATVRTERAAVLVPPVGHRLHGGARGVHTPGALIESARQLATLLGHTAHERGPDAQMLWLSLDADLPVGLPESVPLEWSWEFAPARGVRAQYRMALVEADSGRRRGRVEIAVHTLSRAGYRKRRGAG